MKRKLLVIDEISPYISFLRKVLIGEGFEVSLSCSENEIISNLNKQKPVLILIDVQMNKGEGFAFLKKIKIEMQVKTPVIVISDNKRY